MTTNELHNNPAPSITAPHPVFGKYLSHHPSNRLRLVSRAAVFYAIPVLLLQALFWNVETETANWFLPVVFGLIGLGAFWYAAHLWNREIFLYEQGFTYQQGSQVGQFRYADIVRVLPDIQRFALLGRVQHTGYRYTLITDADEILYISNLYSNVDTLVNRLEALIVRDRLPLIQQAIAAGSSVDVGGGLRLSKTGLEYEGRELFWHELSGQRIQSGHLNLRTQENESWAAIPVAELKNPVLLLAVLKQNTTKTLQQSG